MLKQISITKFRAPAVWLNLILFGYIDLCMQKCYNIMITGTVQDIGFRALIENIARLYELRSYTFNDVDGSVKMVCSSEIGVIIDFLEEIYSRGTEKGVVIHDIIHEEIPFQIYLPHGFSRL